jgi:anti-sigma B factor antagonist
MALEIIQKESHGIVILALKGRLALGQETMDFRAKVTEVLDRNDWYKEKWGWATRMVLDCGELGFVDSAGLGALIHAHTSAINHGAEMKLANLTKKLRSMLAIGKLVTVFDVYDSTEAAVKSFPPSEPAAGAAPA